MIVGHGIFDDANWRPFGCDNVILSDSEGSQGLTVLDNENALWISRSVFLFRINNQ